MYKCGAMYKKSFFYIGAPHGLDKTQDLLSFKQAPSSGENFNYKINLPICETFIFQLPPPAGPVVNLRNVAVEDLPCST